ncbi:MAG: ligase [Lautropia sp.]|nr:ligase [Lautropia sp.]
MNNFRLTQDDVPVTIPGGRSPEGIGMASRAAFQGGGGQVLDAVREQHWNESQLASPVVQPLMKVWCYRQGAIVLGRSQHALAAASGHAGVTGLALVKRGAGGGAVLVGPWLLSVSFLLPLNDPRMMTASVADSYRWLGEAMVATLADIGLSARAVPPAQRIAAPQRLAWACFAGVAPWEVVVDDPVLGISRKLVGFAQRRSRYGVLLAMGVLMDRAPWSLLTGTLGHSPDLAAELATVTVDLASLTKVTVTAEALLARLIPRLQPMQLC